MVAQSRLGGRSITVAALMVYTICETALAPAGASAMQPSDEIATEQSRSSEWQELRGHVQHQTIEVVRIITILVQDALILVVGFVVEFVYDRWLHSEHPLFQVAINLSSALFLLLYVITVTVHIVNYVRGQLGATKATVFGQYLPWALALALSIVVGVAVWTLKPTTSTADTSPIRFLVDTPQNSNLFQASVSPNGRYIAFTAPPPGGGSPQLWVRSLDSTTAQPLPGTENPITLPFWSPDSRFLGFFADGKVKKIEVSGGPPQTLCDTTTTTGGTWNREGVVLWGGTRGIFRVSAAGGQPTKLTTIDTSHGELAHYWPNFLPDGRHFLYTVSNNQPEIQGIYIGALDSKERTRLLPDFSMALYAPAGYLLFVRQGNLMAQPFDAARLQLTGDAVPIAEQVSINIATGQAAFAVSDNGVLAFRTGAMGAIGQLTWFDRAGKQLSTVGSPGVYLNLKLSPDGKRVALEQVTSNNRDIWVLETERGIATRFTFDPAEELTPLWSPDGKYIAFVSTRDSPRSLYQKASSGAGTEEVLLKGGVGTTAHAWSSDGRFITYRPSAGVYIWVLPLFGDRKPFPYLQPEFTVAESEFSPDGKWLAYRSNESGTSELYVQTIPKPGAKWQVSTNGGLQARWRRDGKEFFYLALDGKLMSVPVRGGDSLEFGASQALFATHTVFGTNTGPGLQQQYDVSPDGQRFLMNVSLQSNSAAPITVVLNWLAGLKK